MIGIGTAKESGTKFDNEKYATLKGAMTNMLLDIPELGQLGLKYIHNEVLIGTPAQGALVTPSAKQAQIQAVQTRLTQHKQARLPNPVRGHFCYSNARAALQRMLGKPHTNTPVVTRDMVVRLPSPPRKPGHDPRSAQ